MHFWVYWYGNVHFRVRLESNRDQHRIIVCKLNCGQSHASQSWTLLLLLAQLALSAKACLYHYLWAWLSSVTYWFPHSRIVSPTYGGTVQSGLKTHDGHVVKSYELTTVPRDSRQHVQLNNMPIIGLSLIWTALPLWMKYVLSIGK